MDPGSDQCMLMSLGFFTSRAGSFCFGWGGGGATSSPLTISSAFCRSSSAFSASCLRRALSRRSCRAFFASSLSASLDNPSCGAATLGTFSLEVSGCCLVTIVLPGVSTTTIMSPVSPLSSIFEGGVSLSDGGLLPVVSVDRHRPSTSLVEFGAVGGLPSRFRSFLGRPSAFRFLMTSSSALQLLPCGLPPPPPPRDLSFCGDALRCLFPRWLCCG
mmetsp:Transcript_53600/g.73228  ORF Transcript_53600/g.73228 Transcript_53600/m.73228 type:complete len:216 (-) Transcript_53600:912-1559(-)